MLITVTSDLHYGITSYGVINKMIASIRATKPEIVVIAGDIAEGLIDFEYIVKEFVDQLPFSKILVIAGNHDLWVRNNSEVGNSRVLFDITLKELTEKSGAIWIENSNYIINNCAIVGSYLHYDYSSKESTQPYGSLPNEFYEKNKSSFNNDAIFLKGLPRDIEFANEIGEQFMNRLTQAQNDNNINNIVVVTHVPCIDRLCTRKPYDASWSYGCPYFGNITYEKDILNKSKVKAIVCGHNHSNESHIIDRSALGMSPVNAMIAGSDYHKPNFVTVLI